MLLWTYHSYRIIILVFFPYARLQKWYTEKINTFYGCMQVYYSLICGALAAKKKYLHRQLSYSSTLYSNRLVILLEIEVNYYIQNHTLGKIITLWTASLPCTPFCHSYNWTTYRLATQDSLRRTDRLLTTLWIVQFGEVIKMSKWMGTNANGKTAHTSVLVWFQKQTEQLKLKGKQWLICWMLLIQRF